MSEANPNSLLQVVAGRHIHEPRQFGAAGVGETVANLNNMLGIETTWEQNGTVYTDRSRQRTEQIALAIQEAKTGVAGITKAALALEALGLDKAFGRPIKFQTMEEYVRFGFEKYQVERKFSLTPETFAGLTNGLVLHWRSVAEQVIEDKYAEHINWERFNTDLYVRRTRWKSRKYLDESRDYGWLFDAQGGVSVARLQDKRFFPSPWLTHSTSVQKANSILASGSLSSIDVNLSASKVITRGTAVTFLFDAHEVIEAVPLVYGDYFAAEHELTTHLPVPIRLVRAIVPTKILMNQGGHSYYGEGWQNTDLVPELIH